jgi:hypothetical protein
MNDQLKNLPLLFQAVDARPLPDKPELCRWQKADQFQPRTRHLELKLVLDPS